MTIMTMDNRLILRHGPIDRDHQDLFDAIDQLALALSHGKERPQCAGFANRLLDLARIHFAMEEELMQRHRYPQTARHKSEHDEFIARVADLKNRIEIGQDSDSDELPARLRDWLGTHITLTDKALVAELRSQNY